MKGLGLFSLVVFLCGCAATQPQPEIVGREYATRISGDGVVDAEDSVATLEEEEVDYGSPEDARAAADEIHDLLAPAPDFVEESTLRVLEVSRAGGPDGTKIVVQLSRAPDTWKSSELEGPPRCMVDVHAPTAENFGPRSVNTDDPLAPRVRVGHYPDRLRVVVDESAAVAGTCTATMEESALVLSLGDGAPTTAAVDVWQAYDVPPGAHAHAAHALARSASEVPPAPPNLETASMPAAAEPPPDLGEAYAEAPPPPPPAASKPDPGPAGPSGVPGPAGGPPRNPYASYAGDEIIDDNDVGAPRRKVYSGRRISLEFKDADILNVLRIIADVAHRNIVATDDVAGRVTIVLYDVPWDQALEILLKSTGLEMVEYDDVITISTAKRLEEERKARLAAQVAGRRLEPLQTAYLKVNYVKARDLAELLRGNATTSAAGAAAANQIAGEDSAGQRRGLLSGRGTVMTNDATNTLIVRDISDGVANARELVRRLDVQTPQVAIQGLIFEADTDMARDLGVRWGASYVASPETGNPTGKNFPGRIAVGGAGPRDTIDGEDGETAGVPILVDFPARGVAAGAGSTLGLVLGSLDGSSQIDAQVTAIEQAGKGKVISRPKVITLNNAEAQIQSLEILRVRLPSTGTVINTGAGGAAGGNTVATQAIDTGIILRVTPQVSNDGYILLQMFVKSSVPSTATTDDIPNEISRQATSQVLVRDGETVVIGGVYRQQANNAEGGVPWLKDIPILGWLFKNRSTQDRRQELLVFITPRVVWRTVQSGALPSAAKLWKERDKSAYEILSPDAVEPDPISAIPG